MNTDERRAILVSLIATLVGAGLALAGSQHGATVAGIGVFTIAVAATFVVQWVVFVPSFLRQTERLFDLTGSLTFIVITVALALSTPAMDARSWLLAVMVVAWALRLGSFLFARVNRSGGDDRFDELKPSFFRFGQVWTVQGLWVSLTAAAAWIAISAENRVSVDAFAVVGTLLWAFGLLFEVVADRQKSRFKADPTQTGRFISVGLWSRSRHPNYFGEIVVWVGVTIVAIPVLHGWQWIGLLSPLFVTLLLTKVSGIPLLEAKADRKWGGQPDYEEYKAKTPVLIPRLW
jgi:steroid 5-alpha reductase family enzyme